MAIKKKITKVKAKTVKSKAVKKSVAKKQAVKQAKPAAAIPVKPNTANTAETTGPVTKQMLIGEIARKYPHSIEVMFRHGMHCIGCGMTAYESLEQGCMSHGLSEQEIDEMVKEINEKVKQ